MSDITTVARPYAKAVFELAQESKTLAEWSQQLGTLDAIASDPQMQSYLANPSLSAEQRAEMINGVVGNLSAEAKNLVSVLAENNRLIALPEIVPLFEALKAEAESVLDAEVTSAYELSESQTSSILKALEKRFDRKIRLENKLNPDLIGGAVIRVGDVVIDGSIQGKLEKISSAISR